MINALLSRHLRLTTAASPLSHYSRVQGSIPPMLADGLLLHACTCLGIAPPCYVAYLPVRCEGTATRCCCKTCTTWFQFNLTILLCQVWFTLQRNLLLNTTRLSFP